MGTIKNALKDGKIVGGVIAVGLMAALGGGLVAVANAAPGEPTVLVTEDPALTIDLTDTDANGLAAEQEAEGAAVEAARVAAEAEAARIAAEQAAAAEAARIAAEQAADAEAETYEPEPEPVDEWAGKMPVPFIVDPNPENAAGGFYDVSQCPSGSASTGPDGVPYCD